MVGVEEGSEFRFRGDLYSQDSTFPLVLFVATSLMNKAEYIKGQFKYRGISLWVGVYRYPSPARG